MLAYQKQSPPPLAKCYSSATRSVSPLVRLTAGLRALHGNERADAALLGGRFRILNVVADGAFSRIAIVADVLHAGRRDRIAVKVLRADAGALGRREAAVLALLRASEAVPRLYGAFECGPHFCLVMEACGPPLSAIIAKGPAGDALTRKVAAKLLAALACLRAAQVIHADLKPDNVLVAGDDVRLVDFGNAIRPREALRYFDDFEIQTPGYRAPEVVAGLPFGFAIDVFSLGLLLVELGTGRRLLEPAGAGRGEALAALERALGPLPRLRYAGAKFYTIGPDDDADGATRRRRLLCAVRRRVVGAPLDVSFGPFVADLLEPDPDLRASPRAALGHAYLAPFLPFRTLLAGAEAPRAAPASSAWRSSPPPPEPELVESPEESEGDPMATEPSDSDSPEKDVAWHLEPPTSSKLKSVH